MSSARNIKNDTRSRRTERLKFIFNEEGIFCQSFLDLLAQKSNAFFSAADAFEDTFREGSEIESTDA